jgi:hypothetical protein
VKGNGCRAFAGAAIFLVMSLSALSADAQSAQDWMKCMENQKIAEDGLIASCNAALESGGYGLNSSVRAYFIRANAYLRKGDFGRAIADFSQVIQL